MADNKKISEFSGKSTLAGSEKFAVASEGANYSITAENLRTYMQDGVVHEVAGKGLSANDYTTEEKRKLSALPTNATLSADIAVAKRQVFVDMWLAVNGFYMRAKPQYAGYITQYDATNDKYIVHTPETPEYDMTLTKEEAMRTLMALTTQSNFTREPFTLGLRVVLPPLNYHFGSGPAYEGLTMARWSGELEVLFLAYGKMSHGDMTVTLYSSGSSELKFDNYEKLRAIIGKVLSYKRPVSFPGCKKLEYFRFIISTDFNVQSCPLVRLDSLQYLVANAANGSTVITVTVHPDVYAKLTGDTSNAAVQALTVEELAQWQALVATAQQKKISFATTTNS